MTDNNEALEEVEVMLNTLDGQDRITRLWVLLKGGILEDSQCGDTGEWGYWIEPENRKKIRSILDE